jgi:hypothetical protein
LLVAVVALDIARLVVLVAGLLELMVLVQMLELVAHKAQVVLVEMPKVALPMDRHYKAVLLGLQVTKVVAVAVVVVIGVAVLDGMVIALLEILVAVAVLDILSLAQ